MSFHNIPVSGNTPLPRFGHTLTYYTANKVVLFGGATGYANQFYMTDSTYSLDIGSRTWSKVATTGTTPSPRAAHASVSHQSNQLLVYGGATGTGGLASDDLFLLDLKDNIGIWNTVNVSGKTPGKRYGHSLNYSKPCLVLFGGNTGEAESNDCWILDIQHSPPSWIEVTCKGEPPAPRAYHSSALCSAGSAKGMIIVFGGRSREKEALSDTWGLTRHRNNTYEWLRAPQKGLCTPTGRYQHSCIFLGPLLIVVGGKSEKGDEPVPLQVYDMMKNEWSSFECVERFRHDTFISQNDLYVYGGFNLRSPSVPTDSLIKLNLLTVFSQSTSLLSTIEELTTQQDMLSSGRAQRTPSAITTDRNTRQLMPNTPSRQTPTQQAPPPVLTNSRRQENRFRLMEPVTVQPDQRSRFRLDNSHPKRMIAGKTDIAGYFLNNLLQPQYYRNIDQLKFAMNPEHILNLVDLAEQVFRDQPTVLNVRAPLKIFGDIHGQYADLMTFFELYGSPHLNGKKKDIENFDYIFIGDFVDRGSHSLETILLLLALKVAYPNQIHLIRGNHEDIGINTDFGFMEQCEEKCQEDPQDPNSVFQRINRVFQWLPLAAVVEQKILCIHGGIGANVRTIDDIRQIQRPVEVVQEVTTREHKLILDILWSDPTESDAELGVQANTIRDPNQTGNIVKYGPDRVHEFLQRNNLGMIIRAHECVMDGFQRFAGGALITVFSATDYCKRHKNAGAILIIKTNLEIIPKLIYPSNDEANNWRDDEEQLRKRPPTPPRHPHRN